ncbi:hypothetical protein D7V97_26915 [Corallococcus sp. CA053C]|uniref:hypothetical protein n=1 Tax=Corallococcus sp. CA053C TaxID=2316732 RepID=UPI000EA32341|nr:hypothetical protein [Corallococcus sp. CA053C]RKH03147.1 hypothetical protein D7V97_26915 [Corallococcus sp. CA053C]
MDGGLAIFGFGLFLLSIANLFARTSYWLAWPLLLISMVTMGMAFSESKRLRNVSLGASAVLAVLGIIAWATGTPWWLTLAVFLFAVAFGMLWAEFRYTYFGHVTQEQLPHRAKRGPVHWPWQRRRVH